MLVQLSEIGRLGIDLGLWVVSGLAAYVCGYVRGLNRNHEAMRRTAQRKLIKAQATSDFLTAAAPVQRPRSKVARVKGTSRQSTQAGPDE